MTATMAFEGFVAPDVPADDPPGPTCAGMTTRIGGDDVLAIVTEVAAEVEEPITASLVIGNLAPVVGDLHVSRGHDYNGDDPDDFESAFLEIGDTDVLRLLEGMEGDQVQFDLTLAPKAPEPPQIVVVEAAHHFDHYGVAVKPGHELALDRKEAQALATDGYLERESVLAAGLEMVPA